MDNHFVKLAAIDCSGKVEKKNGLSYLSWAWAVDQLLRADPSAEWTYGEPARWNDTVMVYCTVTAFGKPRTMQLPVMDHRNKAIPNPDAFQVNTAMQRALVKAIALHGLGLYIYAGEDLPPNEEGETSGEVKAKAKPEPKAISPTAGVIENLTPEQMADLHDCANHARGMLMEGDDMGAWNFIKGCNYGPEMQTGLWTLLDSKERAALKKAKAALTGEQK